MPLALLIFRVSLSLSLPPSSLPPSARPPSTSLPHLPPTTMLLGKRSSPPIKRTASSIEFPGRALFDVEVPQPLVQDGPIAGQPLDLLWGAVEVAQRSPSWYVGSMPSPRRRLGGAGNFSVLPGTASFLRACGLCNRSLGPGRDAYMYRYFLSPHRLPKIPSF